MNEKKNLSTFCLALYIDRNGKREKKKNLEKLYSMVGKKIILLASSLSIAHKPK